MSETTFKPIKIIDVELTEPLPAIQHLNHETGEPYGGVFCLVRHQGRPVEIVEFLLQGENISASELQQRLNHIKPPAEQPTRRGRLADPPFISVVIATRDRPESLSVCLDSILGQDYPAFDVIVVDNAPSTAKTAELIRSRYAHLEKVRYVREDRAGLGRAHNSGMEHVTAPIAAFTDDDVIADPRWLLSFAENFDGAPRTGCVTGLILPAELETRAQFWTERHGGFSKGFQRRLFDLEGQRPPGPLFPYTAGQFGSGANMAFRTEALRRIGGFDSALGAGTIARGGDDLAAFFAVIDAGYQLVYEPSAIVWHHHRRSEQGIRNQAFGYGMGLGAYLTKLVAEDPARLLRLARILPAGLSHMMGSSSPKNRRLPDDYPKSLVWRERLGIAAGVPNYFRSRRAVRRQSARHTADGTSAAIGQPAQRS